MRASVAAILDKACPLEKKTDFDGCSAIARFPFACSRFFRSLARPSAWYWTISTRLSGGLALSFTLRRRAGFPFGALAHSYDRNRGCNRETDPSDDNEHLTYNGRLLLPLYRRAFSLAIAPSLCSGGVLNLWSVDFRSRSHH